MFVNLLKSLSKNKKTNKSSTAQRRDPERYESEKRELEKALKEKNVSRRMTLASDSKTHKEILYYMAENDPDADVRKAIAENDSTPVQVSGVLAQDQDSDVRMALAERLVKLLPDLSEDKQSQLYAYAVQALGTLALDEVLKIRIALSSTLKDHAHAPPKVVGKLARDVEQEVSEPILRFCAALSDDDLIEILRDHPASWAIQAIASRPAVSENVSEAVIQTDDGPGGRALIGNEGAQITETLLTKIVQSAKRFPEWQKPVAQRKNLSPDMAKQLASYVDESVKKMLLQRSDFDKETLDEISDVFRRRLDFAMDEDMNDGETPAMRVRRLKNEGKLGEESISDALAMRDRDFIYAALALMVNARIDDIARIFEMKAPKPVVAVSWKAGLSMRMAFHLQKDLAQVNAKELVYPRDGADYPFTPEEMNWQLEFLGLKAA